MGENFVPAIGRSIAEHEKYLEHIDTRRRLGQIACDLCAAVERQDREGLYPYIGQRAVAMTNQAFALINNDYPYSTYDGQKVESHHMLVPRQHIDYDSLKRDPVLRHWLADAEAEAMELSGYRYTTSMIRTSTSQASSIKAHAHQHLFVTSAPVIEQNFSIPEQRNDIRFSDGSSL